MNDVRVGVLIMVNELEYVLSGQLRRDVQSVLAGVKSLLKESEIMANELDQIEANEQQILANEQSEAKALAALMDTMKTTHTDLSAEIASLQAQNVDTAKLQAILDAQQSSLSAQQANLASIQTAQSTEASEDPGAQPAPSPEPAPTPAPDQPAAS